MSKARDDAKRNARWAVTIHLAEGPCPRCGAMARGHFLPPSLGEPGRYVCEMFPQLSLDDWKRMRRDPEHRYPVAAFQRAAQRVLFMPSNGSPAVDLTEHVASIKPARVELVGEWL